MATATTTETLLDRRLEQMAVQVEGELPKFAKALRDRQGQKPAKKWAKDLTAVLEGEATDDTDPFVVRQARSFAEDFSIPEGDRPKELTYYLGMRRGALVRKAREAKQPKSPVIDTEGLDDLTVKELRELAHRPELKIELPAKAKKRDIIDAIAEAAS